MVSSDRWVRTNAAYRAVVKDWPRHGLLGCSGGTDSSALLVLAGIGVRRGDISSFTVAHVDHQTRPESAQDGVFVERLASTFGLPVVHCVVDRSDAEDAGSSLEERWRLMRYASLARAARAAGATTVVTAHTRDDQIETILMRLLSGAGGLAQAGMRPNTTIATVAGTIEIHRPLLDIRRDQLDDVLVRIGISPLVDPTNVDRAYLRNAIRADVIPVVRALFPGFESCVVRSSVLASRDADALDRIADAIVASIGVGSQDETRVYRSLILDQHPAIATRIIRWAAGRLMPLDQRELTFERVESVRHAAAGRSGALIELPYGIVALIETSEIVFGRRNN